MSSLLLGPLLASAYCCAAPCQQISLLASRLGHAKMVFYLDHYGGHFPE